MKTRDAQRADHARRAGRGGKRNKKRRAKLEQKQNKKIDANADADVVSAAGEAEEKHTNPPSSYYASSSTSVVYDGDHETSFPTHPPSSSTTGDGDGARERRGEDDESANEGEVVKERERVVVEVSRVGPKLPTLMSLARLLPMPRRKSRR